MSSRQARHVAPPSPLPRPLRIAHRGVPGRRPENTLAGFQLALDLCAHGLELDVHTSADGVVVVHHDAELPDGRPIRTLPASAICRHEQGEARVPTLAEVCTLVGSRAWLFVELKGEAIEQAVVAVLARHAGPAAVHSFDHPMIGRLAESGCPWPLGLLFEDDVRDALPAMARWGATHLWPQHALVDGALVDAVHGRGGWVIPWTVNQVGDARSLARLGVDGLCGDDVTRFDALP